MAADSSNAATGWPSDGREVSVVKGSRSPSPATSAPTASDPPLPQEAVPEDDGWDARFDNNTQAWYFCNRFTGRSQWENPRVPEASAASYGSYGSYYHSSYATSTAPGTTSSYGAPGTTSSHITTAAPTTSYPTTTAPGTTTSDGAPGTSSAPRRPAGGYNPAIHGNYDPNADYALEARRQEEEDELAAASASRDAAVTAAAEQGYGSTAQFNRFTGRFQHPSINPENHNDENKSRRQMNAFFDVDAAANSHDGRSLKEERRNKQISRKELQAFKKKKREKKEQKRLAWLRE